MENHKDEQNKKLDKLISDEILRFRINRILSEPSKSWFQKFTHNPLTAIIIGFLLTWGIGTQLTDNFKKSELENQRSIDRIKSKRENGIIAVNYITVLMYERYSTFTLLESSLKRNASFEELKERKKLYDEAYLKWNNNLQVTLFAVRGLTSNTAYSKIEQVIEHGLTPHFATIDNILTQGYDARLRNKKWDYPQSRLSEEFTACLGCCYSISNYLWIKTNLYGDEKLNTKTAIKTAEDELDSICKGYGNSAR